MLNSEPLTQVSLPIVEKPVSGKIARITDNFSNRIVRDDFKGAGKIFYQNISLITADLEKNNNSSSSLWMLQQLLSSKDPGNINLAGNFVEENFEKIAKKITDAGIKDSNYFSETGLALNVLSTTLEFIPSSTDNGKSDKYLELFDAIKDKLTIQVMAKDTYQATYLATILLKLHRRDKDIDAQKAKDHLNIIDKILFDKDVHSDSRHLFFTKFQSESSNMLNALLSNKLSKYINDPEIRRDVIRSFQEKETFRGLLDEDEIYSTFDTCEQIDKEIPGGSERLNKLFGITHFSRYTPEMLIRQLKDWDNEDTSPYGIMLSSWGDWNTTFSGGGTQKGKNISINNQLNHLGIKMRIIEAKNLDEFINRQLEISEKFKNKAHFLIINAHGSPDGFNLGWSSGKVIINDIDLIKQKLSNIYLPNMQTLFFSCSTGVKNGFANRWADSRMESVGPDHDASVKDVEIFSRPGGLVGFRVVYEGATANRYP